MTDFKAPNPGPQFLEQLKKQKAGIGFIIFRSKNDNVVVYEANLDAQGNFHRSQPIKVYWLEVDVKYRQKRRQRGVKHDVVGLNFIERKFVFGTHQKYLGPRHASFQLKIAPEYKFEMKVGGNGQARCLITHNNQRYQVHSIFADCSENLKLLNWRQNLKRLTASVHPVGQFNRETLILK